MAAAPVPEADADRCPYSRAFTRTFDDCAAFTPADYVPLDTQYRPLGPVLTCRHLDIGESEAGGYYPRCALGSPDARQVWVATVGAHRLQRLRALSHEYREWVRPPLSRVWEKKARLLAEGAEGSDGADLRAALQDDVAALIDSAHAWIEKHAAALADAGLEPAALSALVDAATAEWADSPLAGVDYRIPDEILARFPAPVQSFIRAGR